MFWTHKIALCHQQRLLVLQIWFIWSTIPKDTDSPYGLFSQPCHAGFIALDFSKYWLLYCHMKMERVRERGRLRGWREQYQEKRERNIKTTKIQIGKTDGIWQAQIHCNDHQTTPITAYVSVCYDSQHTTNKEFQTINCKLLRLTPNV